MAMMRSQMRSSLGTPTALPISAVGGYRPFTPTRAGLWAAWILAVVTGGWASGAHAEKSIVVDYTETHDRIAPTAKTDIRHKRTIVAVLNINGTVSERLTTVCLTCNAPQTKKRGRLSGGRDPFQKSSQEEAQLGEPNGKVRWTVLNTKTLKRVHQHGALVDVITVRLLGPDRCEVDVRFFREDGKTVLRQHAAFGNSIGDYTVPVLQSSSCSIEDRRI